MGKIKNLFLVLSMIIGVFEAGILTTVVFGMWVYAKTPINRLYKTVDAKRPVSYRDYYPRKES
ncbi:MAG: hypothetical protein IJ716_14625 [Lachnospiraceae bacterium]|nr:hypothetical protein [Lachnospiraceae bacterium]